MEKVLFLDSPMKEKLYGSRRIQEKFGLGPMDKKIGEYWAISAHDNGLSKIKNGKYKGETLKDVYLNHRELFANDPHDKFPLLVKINEIQEPCSVQVHPDDAYARKYESDYGKAEFCLWLDVEEGTKIIRGHSAKTKEEFRKAIEEKSGIAHKLILEWVNLADLFRIKGVAEEYSDLLEEAGVDTVVELAGRNAENLFAKVTEVNEKKN